MGGYSHEGYRTGGKGRGSFLYVFITSFDVPWFCIAKIELRESLAIKKSFVFFQFCSVSSMAFRIARASMVKIEFSSSGENLKMSSSVTKARLVLSLDFDPSV